MNTLSLFLWFSFASITVVLFLEIFKKQSLKLKKQYAELLWHMAKRTQRPFFLKLAYEESKESPIKHEIINLSHSIFKAKDNVSIGKWLSQIFQGSSSEYEIFDRLYSIAKDENNISLTRWLTKECKNFPELAEKAKELIKKQ
jgi:hypothetical protein